MEFRFYKDPLIVMISGGDTTVFIDQELELDGSASYNPNVPEAEKTDGLTYSWTCPDIFNCGA